MPAIDQMNKTNPHVIIIPKENTQHIRIPTSQQRKKKKAKISNRKMGYVKT